MEPKWANAATEHCCSPNAQDLQEMLTHSGFHHCDRFGDLIFAVPPHCAAASSRAKFPVPRIYTAGFATLSAQRRSLLSERSSAGSPRRASAAFHPGRGPASVERNIAAGADVLKLFTGSYVTPSTIKPMPLDIARKQPLPLRTRMHQIAFAHPSNLEGVRVAMDSGVDVLAHAPSEVHGIDDTLLAELVAHHMSMIPTLKLFWESNRLPRIAPSSQVSPTRRSTHIRNRHRVCDRLRLTEEYRRARARGVIVQGRVDDVNHGARQTTRG